MFDRRSGAPEAELSVVVSPLVSLVVDQVSSLPSRGISDAILSGNSENTLPMKETIKTGQLPSLLVRGEIVSAGTSFLCTCAFIIIIVFT